jgi:hypothetical protein
MRGHFPSGLDANKQFSFILLPASADKRSGGVSGALRGGQERGGDTLLILLVFARHREAAASRRGPKEENITPSAPVPEATLAKTSATRCPGAPSPGSRHSWKNRGPHEQVRATRAYFPVAPTGVSSDSRAKTPASGKCRRAGKRVLRYVPW